MRHITPYSIYESIRRDNLVSPTLSPIRVYFETAQGSKYLLSDAGETKRWKSAHANTGGEDAGLKGWYPNSMFVPEEDVDKMLAYEHLLNKGYKISLSSTPNGKLTWVIYKDNKWIPATYQDAYPTYSRLNPDKATKPLVFSFSPAPSTGLMAVEYKKDANGLIRSFHPGSPVSKVMSVEQADPRDLAHFNIK
jgi:hypothetical protein